MPIYDIYTKEGALDDDQRARLASEITHIHVEETGAPIELVSVLFHELLAGRTFRAGRPSSPNMIRGQIRAGRTLETRQSIVRRINDVYAEVTGVDAMDLAVGVSDVVPEWSMEGGTFLPEPNPEEEAAWLAQTGSHGR